jgi:hypothetical protein
MILPAAQLPRLSFTDVARVRREAALEASALIARVQDSGEQDKAVQAQLQLDTLRREVEAARKSVKAPVLDLSREIDRVAGDWIQEVAEESARIGFLVADYQALELKKRQAAERAARLEAERIERERREQEEAAAAQIERERQAALAAAKSIEEQDEIERKACEQQRIVQENLDYHARKQQLELVASIAPPDRADGQCVRYAWDFKVTNMMELVRMHPGCVEMKPRRREIIDLLSMGHKVAGIEAFQVVKSTTRAAKKVEVEV